MEKEELLNLRGKVDWEGDLNEMRSIEHPVKITVCRCRQCTAKKKSMHNRKAVRFFKRHTNKQRRTKSGKHIHFCWA